jgi:Domain of unknown function (DUF4304)
MQINKDKRIKEFFKLHGYKNTKNIWTKEIGEDLIALIEIQPSVSGGQYYVNPKWTLPSTYDNVFYYNLGTAHQSLKEYNGQVNFTFNKIQLGVTDDGLIELLIPLLDFLVNNLEKLKSKEELLQWYKDKKITPSTGGRSLEFFGIDPIAFFKLPIEEKHRILNITLPEDKK